MAGKGGIDDVGGVADTIASPVGKVTTRPLISLTWTKTSSTLGLGTITSSPPQGGLNADGHGQDPDQFVGSFTIAPSAPTLGLGTIVSPTGKGDVGDVYGSPDLSSQDPNVSGLIAWNAGAPSLGLGTITSGGPQGPVDDPETFQDQTPTLGVGTLVITSPKGDIEGDYRNGTAGAEGRWFIATWAPATPTLGLGTIAPSTPKGDITDPYAWQDAIFYFTSQLYPLIVTENFLSSGVILFQPQYQYAENILSQASVTGGTLTSSVIVYTNWPAEDFLGAAAITSGTLVDSLVTYSNWPAENFLGAAAITSGTLVDSLVTYSNWPAENFLSAGSVTGGTLA